MVAPAVEQLRVTFCVEEYVPGSGLAVGVATFALLSATVTTVLPDCSALKLMVFMTPDHALPAGILLLTVKSTVPKVTCVTVTPILEMVVAFSSAPFVKEHKSVNCSTAGSYCTVIVMPEKFVISIAARLI